MSRKSVFRVACVLMLLMALATGSASAQATERVLTAPANYPELRGMTVQVPDGMPTAPEEQIWKALAEAKAKSQSNGPSTMGISTIPVFWYEEQWSDTGHTRWFKGGTVYNRTSQPATLTVSVKTSVSSSFTGSFPAKQVVQAVFDASFGASLELIAESEIVIPARTNSAMFAAAWGSNHKGKVHFDYINSLGRYVRGPVSNVSFFLLNVPLEPIFEPMEGVCYSCTPKPPRW
jgi:hypothetical protein